MACPVTLMCETRPMPPDLVDLVAISEAIATQSTTRDTNEAMLAKDGNRAGTLDAGSCSSTLPTDSTSDGAWWQIDLGGVRSVYGIQVRVDWPQDRQYSLHKSLCSFVIHLLDDL